MENLPDKSYTEKELTRAKTTAKVVGWMQGGGVVLGGAILWNLLGWVPVALGLAAGGWLLFKMVSRPKGEDGQSG